MIIDGKPQEKKRKEAEDKIKTKYPFFDLIRVKRLGCHTLAIVGKADSEELSSNPPQRGKFPMIIIEQGANPGTERILPIQWRSQDGEPHEIQGSIILIKDNGEIIGNPGLISSPK